MQRDRERIKKHFISFYDTIIILLQPSIAEEYRVCFIKDNKKLLAASVPSLNNTKSIALQIADHHKI